MTSFPIISGLLIGKSLTQFEGVIRTLESAHADRAIANPVFNATRESANRLFESIWNKGVNEPYIDSGKYNSLSPKENALYDELALAPQCHTVNAFVKRVTASRIATDYTRRMAEVLGEMKRIADMFATLKDNDWVKKRETKAEREARETYKAPRVPRAGEVRVRAILTEIAEGAREKLVQSYAEGDRGLLAAYLEAKLDYVANLPSHPTHYMSANEYFVGRHKQPYMRNPRAAAIVGRLVVQRLSSEPPVVRADAEERILESARADADQTVRLFIEKNLAKIVSIVEAKGNLETATIIGDAITTGGLRGEIAFRFKDGARFTVRNAVVYHCHQSGTQYQRFPLTFHHAVRADGRRINGVSEKKMNEEFAR